jgi:hypothetical protein
MSIRLPARGQPGLEYGVLFSWSHFFQSMLWLKQELSIVKGSNCGSLMQKRSLSQVHTSPLSKWALRTILSQSSLVSLTSGLWSQASIAQLIRVQVPSITILNRNWTRKLRVLISALFQKQTQFLIKRAGKHLQIKSL